MQTIKFLTILFSGAMILGLSACSNAEVASTSETTIAETVEVVETTQATLATQSTQVTEETEAVVETVAETEPFIRPECNIADITCNIGDKVEYGSFIVNSNGDSSPITWTCLDIQDDMALLLSDKVLDCRMYHGMLVDTTWAECDLRAWLNDEFISMAFTPDEASCIWYSDIVNSNNPTNLTSGGADTIDQIFILDYDELNAYFADDEARLCLPTEYAVENGCWTSDFQVSEGCTNYWLRNPGLYSSRAGYVFLNGAIISDGDFVNQTFVGVRPAMWVKIA